MSREQTDWIDKRLRETTALGEASALAANDIAANLPEESRHDHTIVVETSGKSVLGVYSDIPTPATVIHVDRDEAKGNPEGAARRFEAEPLAVLDKESKAIMFDAGVAFRHP